MRNTYGEFSEYDCGWGVSTDSSSVLAYRIGDKVMNNEMFLHKVRHTISPPAYA